MGGNPVFSGTRIPINLLFGYLENGDSLVDRRSARRVVFLNQYPDIVSREQAIAILELAEEMLITYVSPTDVV